MVSFSFLSSLLIGITLLSVYGVASETPRVPVIDVSIEIKSPNGNQSNCTAKEQKKLNKMIQKVVSKRFDQFYEQAADMYALNDTVTEICPDSVDRLLGGEQGGATLAENHPHRSLQPLKLRGSGWIYSKSYKCGYCDPDDSDCGRTRLLAEGLQAGLSRKLCGPPTTGKLIKLTVRLNDVKGY